MLYLMVFVNCLDIICSFTTNFTIVKGLLRWEEELSSNFASTFFLGKHLHFFSSNLDWYLSLISCLGPLLCLDLSCRAYVMLS